MATIVPISARIENLIQRIGNVKVCQDHLKLIATSLTRIQYALSNTHAVVDDNNLHNDISQTLNAIVEIVASCSGIETDINGVTYRDLQALLLRLQLRLTQHEANMTDDYEAKVHILSNAYHEQQILMQKSFDETMKHRLEAIEQRTKENNAEQLRLLREKHIKTIKSYLDACTELHKGVPIIGVTKDTVVKVAHTFYQISSEDNIQLERNWQAFELPLTRTFVQLTADKSTSFERNESRRLLVEPDVTLLHGSHCRTELSKGIWQRLVSAPYMMSMLERGQTSEESDVNEENIIRTKRWIVILGDPGSGKTSFARWLVRHLAQTLLLNGQHSTDYGPLRIPILIRIGEFAEMLRDHSSLTLFDYIGQHKWMGKSIVADSSISLHKLSCALQDYIKHGQALIILDGLDEIPVSDQRSKIINIVENFVDTYVQTPTGASVFDNPHLSKLFDDPSKLGGNQLIVTSRIVGYHAAPLAGQFSHYTIRPMDMEHMKDFVNYWFFRMHQQILDTVHLSVSNQGENHGEALKKELEKSENVSLLDVASNSCLMSFICSVAFNQSEGSPLPTQRICLYEQIVNSMLSLWSSKRSSIPIPELIRLLSDVATYIHQHSASGLIHEETMKEVCIQSIQASFNKTLLTKEDIENIESQASEFVRIIREDVGILAARGESLYGFLHLTFQEYFTCLKLIDVDKLKQKQLNLQRSYQEKKIPVVAQLLRHRTNDPRFRVPIALALGKISSSWSQKYFDDFCCEFIKEEDQSNSLIPLGAYMLIVCGNDLVNYPSSDVLFDTLNRLMIAAGQHKWSIVCPFLFDQLTNALRKLRNDIVPLWIHNLLSRSPSHDIQTISALCHLIEGKSHEFENIKWLDQSSCLMLQSLSALDNENNEFAIDRLLVKIAFTNHRLLPIESSTFKEFLLSEEIELNLIPVVLLPLIITLYGGLKRDGQMVVFDPFRIHRESAAITPMLIRFLSIKDRSKQDQGLKKLKQECIKSFVARTQNHDESWETVDLCVATICLYGIEYVQDNLTAITGIILQMTMNRFKYMSMILRQFYFASDENDRSIENETTKFIGMVVEKFQYGESARVQFLDLLDSIRSSLARLRSLTKSILLEGVSKPDKRIALHLPNSLRKEDKFLNGLLSTDVQFYSNRNSCTLLHHFTKLFWIFENNDDFDSQYRMAVAMDTVPEYLLFRNDEDVVFPITFVPSHLRNLFVRLLKQKFIMINPGDPIADDKPHLYFGHILIECFMLLSNASCKRLSLVTALITLLPMLRMHHLENLGSSLLWTLATKYSEYLAMFEINKEHALNYETGQYIKRVETITSADEIVDEERRRIIRDDIEQEHQRHQNALIENDGRNIKLYSATVSLAHACRWSADERKLCLLDESVQGAMLITNKLARLDALCVIGFYSQSDYNQIHVNTGRSLQQEIEYQFNEIYQTLPLLLHAASFLRCLPLLRNQSMINMCLQNLFDKFGDNDQRDQQAVNEALSPYIQSNFVFSSVMKYASRSLSNNTAIYNKSSVLKKYFNIRTDESLSLPVLISNFYLVELSNDFHECLKTDVRQFTMDESVVTKLFQIGSSILTVAQAFIISSVLVSISSSNRSKQLEKLCVVLNNLLHHVNLVEFKACHLVESWMRWKDSNELSSFAYHAALLLTNSDIWSVDAASIICDLLCSDNDRFRQRAQIILRSKSDNDVRTSSKLGIDVLLALITKKAHYYLTSPSASLTLSRMFENTTIDNQSHLETLLWLERYRTYALVNKHYSVNRSTLSPISHVASYFPTDSTIDVSFCGEIRKISHDLIEYMCDLAAYNFSLFLEIDGDTASNAVLESHAQFVSAVLISLSTLVNHTDDTRQLTSHALTKLINISNNDDICQSAAYTLGYVSNEKTYKILFNKIKIMARNERGETSGNSDDFLSALISSYCHCVSVNKIAFDQDDMDLFCDLLKHPSKNVVKAIRTGFGRVLKDKTFLFEILSSDVIQCYHALIASTAYAFVFDVQQISANTTAEFIEEHPDLLPIFMAELYNSIRRFTNIVSHDGMIDYYLAYGHPQYVVVGALVAVRMPAAFCAFIKDWNDGDSLKRALFYTSKQHNFVQRGACLTILSIFGELTVELCEMLIEGLHDDPHVQNTCYKCLTRINSIQDEKVVLNLLFSYLKSKSINVRYVTTKLLLHLSRSSLIPYEQVRIALNDNMSDPYSNEDLWLIEEYDEIMTHCIYYYAGPLKDVTYSLLVQHLTGAASKTVRRNKFNDVNLDFIEAEKASRLASCLYEAKTERNVE